MCVHVCVFVYALQALQDQAAKAAKERDELEHRLAEKQDVRRR